MSSGYVDLRLLDFQMFVDAACIDDPEEKREADRLWKTFHSVLDKEDEDELFRKWEKALEGPMDMVRFTEAAGRILDKYIARAFSEC